jgi:hypothetical protein
LVDSDGWQQVKRDWQRRHYFDNVPSKQSAEHKQARCYDAFAFFEKLRTIGAIEGELYDKLMPRLKEMAMKGDSDHVL